MGVLHGLLLGDLNPIKPIIFRVPYCVFLNYISQVGCLGLRHGSRFRLRVPVPGFSRVSESLRRLCICAL